MITRLWIVSIFPWWFDRVDFRVYQLIIGFTEIHKDLSAFKIEQLPRGESRAQPSHFYVSPSFLFVRDNFLRRFHPFGFCFLGFPDCQLGQRILWSLATLDRSGQRWLFFQYTQLVNLVTALSFQKWWKPIPLLPLPRRRIYTRNQSLRIQVTLLPFDSKSLALDYCANRPCIAIELFCSIAILPLSSSVAKRSSLGDFQIVMSVAKCQRRISPQTNVTNSRKNKNTS